MRLAAFWGILNNASEVDWQRKQVEELISQEKVRREAANPLLKEGIIPESENVLFGDRLDLLPRRLYDSAEYVLDNWKTSPYLLTFFPAAVTKPIRIIFHHDSVCHDFKNDSWERQKQYTNETKYWLNHFSTSAHFSVSPVETVQFLTMGEKGVTRSFGSAGYNVGTINIETTGCHNEITPPESLTDRTVGLIKTLMKYYRIPFDQVFGHMEKAHGNKPVDPSFEWMWHVRAKLYLAMQKDGEIRDNWEFYFPKGCKIADDLGGSWDCLKQMEPELNRLFEEEQKRRNILRIRRFDKKQPF